MSPAITNISSAAASQRMTGLCAVKGMRFRFLNGYAQLRLFNVVSFNNRRVRIAGTALFPQIRRKTLRRFRKHTGIRLSTAFSQ